MLHSRIRTEVLNYPETAMGIHFRRNPLNSHFQDVSSKIQFRIIYGSIGGSANEFNNKNSRIVSELQAAMSEGVLNGK